MNKKIFLFIIYITIGFTNNLDNCLESNFNQILNDIQKYGSKLQIVVENDTIFAQSIIDFNSNEITIELLNEKWSNLTIDQYYNEDYSHGASSPYTINIDQIDCIIEVNRPDYLKEYSFIAFAGLAFWGILYIFQLI
ncbi:MAG: hypothetical protein H8E60_03645 [Candidatus Marinimicrobia bacterium]|nr:hypothetical protein [Candidatus Neomarinimicrobiota bacterium]